MMILTGCTHLKIKRAELLTFVYLMEHACSTVTGVPLLIRTSVRYAPSELRVRGVKGSSELSICVLCLLICILKYRIENPILEDVVTRQGRYSDTVKARSVLCYWATRELGITTLELAKRLRLSQPTASQSAKRGERIVQENQLKVMG